VFIKSFVVVAIVLLQALPMIWHAELGTARTADGSSQTEPPRSIDHLEQPIAAMVTNHSTLYTNSRLTGGTIWQQVAREFALNGILT
jgi:hypothetical protein